MKRQTALQWLLKQWPILESQIPPYIINQAIEMEREEIEDAYIDGQTISNGYQGKSDYYNKTYDQNENRNYARRT